MDNIQKKIITNKDDRGITTSSFFVLSDKDFDKSDWISANKFEQINSKGLSENILIIY